MDWVKSAQDWFRTTERSSGFRPYLIFLLLCFGAGLVLLTFFSAILAILAVAIFLLVVPVLAFIFLFGIKAFQDPQFCRSERHIEKILKIEMEALGSEVIQLEASVVEKRLLTASEPEPGALPEPKKQEDPA